MKFPICIDTISMGLPIVYFKGPWVAFSKLLCTVLLAECDSDAMLCLQSYQVVRIDRSLVY